MLNPAETNGKGERRVFGVFFLNAPTAAPPPMASGAIYVCVCVHACLEEKKNSRVNGDVTVRLLPLQEPAPERPTLTACVCRSPSGGPPLPLHAAFLPPGSELAGTRGYISSFFI